MQPLIEANWRQPLQTFHLFISRTRTCIQCSGQVLHEFSCLALAMDVTQQVASAAFFIWSVSKLVAPKSIRFPSKLAISGGLEASVLPQQRVDWKGGKLKNSGASIRKILFLCIGFETIAAITVFDSSGCWVWATLGRPYACCQKDKHFAKTFAASPKQLVGTKPQE